MLPLKNKRPRCIHRGQLPTGNPQSMNFCRLPLRSHQHVYIMGMVLADIKKNLRIPSPIPPDGGILVLLDEEMRIPTIIPTKCRTSGFVDGRV